jgi:hypothetical protein
MANCATTCSKEFDPLKTLPIVRQDNWKGSARYEWVEFAEIASRMTLRYNKTYKIDEVGTELCQQLIKR